MQLDLNLLTALDALLEEESVTGAADRLNLSAPAMSRTLGRIRNVTGDPILVRTGRTMRPTPRALALREEVRSLVLRSREVLAPETELDLPMLRRTFTIRAHDALTVALAPVLVKRVAEVAPGVSLKFLSEAAEDTADLRRGVVDLEIGSAAPAAHDIHRQHVADDQLVAVARRGHPLLAGAVDIVRYTSFPHIVVSRRGRLRDRIDDIVEHAGHARKVIASVASTMAAIETVRMTDAVVVLPASTARRLGSGHGIKTFPLPFDLPAVPIVVAWHQQLTPDQGHHWLRSLVAVLVSESGDAFD